MTATMSKPRVLLGLIGAGIQQTLSPALHEAEGDAQGLRLQYRIYDLDVLDLGERALPSLLDAARLLGYAGLNITFPCKQTVLPLLDALSDDARAMNAVNTVVFRDGRATGHNTDASGFAHGFRRGLPYASTACVALIGAGGAGSAVAHAMLGSARASLDRRQRSRARRRARARRGRAVPRPHDRRGAGRPRSARRRERHDQRDADRHGQAARHADRRGAARREAMGRRLRVPADRHRAARRRARARLRDARRRRDDVGQAVDAFRLFTGLDPDPARVARHFAALIAAERAAA